MPNSHRWHKQLKGKKFSIKNRTSQFRFQKTHFKKYRNRLFWIAFPQLFPIFDSHSNIG